MNRNTRGFTMVEVMIVLVILGTISAVAIPSIRSNLDEIKLDGAAREVVSALQYCQSMAIKNGISHAVSFHEGLERIKCYDDNTMITVLHPIDKKPYEFIFDNVRNLEGVDIIDATFGFNSNNVSFNSLGEPNYIGSVVIGYGGFQKTITVSGLLGEISVN